MRTIQVIAILLLVLLLACEKQETTTPVEAGFVIEEPEADKLNAYPILGYMQTGGDLAPEIDGRATDYIWQYAPSLDIETQNGKNGYAPTVTMKALYDNWYLYLLITWDDETKSFQKNSWWFGESDPQKYTTINVFDTTFIYYRSEDTVSTNRRIKETVQKDWTMISNFFLGIIETVTHKVNVIIDSTQSSPTITYEDLGTSSKLDTTTISGDEDGFAIMFNHSSSDFISCSNLCHVNSMATDIDEFVDVWRWAAHRTNFIGYTDDKFLTDDGFHGDIGDSSYVLNKSGLYPEYVDILDPGMNSDFLRDSLWVTIVPFSQNFEWEGGNTVPGYILHKPTASRGNIKASGDYEDGIWTLEMKRRLSTTSEPDSTDIEFNPDSDANVDFHIAVFDNSHGQDHAISTTVQVLHFLQLKK